MVTCENLTNREYFRLTGTLSADRIEDMLEKEENLGRIVDHLTQRIYSIKEDATRELAQLDDVLEEIGLV